MIKVDRDGDGVVDMTEMKNLKRVQLQIDDEKQRKIATERRRQAIRGGQDLDMQKAAELHTAALAERDTALAVKAKETRWRFGEDTVYTVRQKDIQEMEDAMCLMIVRMNHISQV